MCGTWCSVKQDGSLHKHSCTVDPDAEAPASQTAENSLVLKHLEDAPPQPKQMPMQWRALNTKEADARHFSNLRKHAASANNNYDNGGDPGVYVASFKFVIRNLAAPRDLTNDDKTRPLALLNTHADTDPSQGDEGDATDTNKIDEDAYHAQQERRKIVNQAVRILNDKNPHRISLAILTGNNPPIELTETNWLKVCDKHVQSTEEIEILDDTRPINASVEISAYELERAIRTGNQTVRDVFNVTFKSVSDAITHCKEGDLLELLAQLCSHLASGFPHLVRDSTVFQELVIDIKHFLGLALAKVKQLKITDGVRPICKAEQVMKMVDTTLTARDHVRKAFMERMPNGQVMDMEAGIEAMGHTANTLKTFFKKVLLLLCLDMFNCFSMLLWAAIVELCDQIPDFAEYSRLIYNTGPQKATYLCIISHIERTIMLTRGCAQGLPSSGYIATALMGVPVMAVQELFGMGNDHFNIVLAIIDDHHFATNNPDLDHLYRFLMFLVDNDPQYLDDEQKEQWPSICERYYEKFKTRRLSFLSVGLDINKAKCVLFCPGLLTTIQQQAWALSGIKIVHDGVVIAGIPIGLRTFVEAFHMDRVTSIIKLLSIIMDVVHVPQIFTENQVQQLLWHVRVGILTQTTFMCRTTEDPSRALQPLVKATRETLSAILRLVPPSDPLTNLDVRFRRLELAFAQGGCGQANLLWSYDAALIGSLSQTMHRIREFIPTNAIPDISAYKGSGDNDTERCMTPTIILARAKARILMKYPRHYGGRVQPNLFDLFKNTLTPTNLIACSHTGIQRQITKYINLMQFEQVVRELPPEPPMQSKSLLTVDQLNIRLFRAFCLENAARGSSAGAVAAHPLSKQTQLNDLAMIATVCIRAGLHHSSGKETPTGEYEGLVCSYCGERVPPRNWIHHPTCRCGGSYVNKTFFSIAGRHRLYGLAYSEVVVTQGKGRITRPSYEPGILDAFPNVIPNPDPSVWLDASKKKIDPRSCRFDFVFYIRTPNHPTKKMHIVYTDHCLKSYNPMNTFLPGVTAQEAEDEKRAKYERRWGPYPLPDGTMSQKPPWTVDVNVFFIGQGSVGGMSSGGDKFVKTVADLIANYGELSPGEGTQEHYSQIVANIRLGMAAFHQSYLARCAFAVWNTESYTSRGASNHYRDGTQGSLPSPAPVPIIPPIDDDVDLLVHRDNNGCQHVYSIGDRVCHSAVPRHIRHCGTILSLNNGVRKGDETAQIQWECEQDKSMEDLLNNNQSVVSVTVLRVIKRSIQPEAYNQEHPKTTMRPNTPCVIDSPPSPMATFSADSSQQLLFPSSPLCDMTQSPPGTPPPNAFHDMEIDTNPLPNQPQIDSQRTYGSDTRAGKAAQDRYQH